ncbi:hypothetical protein L3X38_020055 [Prunus dulcis]|uniref:HXXXD-type acyl-transferase family protein n=1 Tax=Prunus dulcis TaxID=3755 RepID=A0AAD4WCV9_PRUDU|nr:hypothetical protein L3X38_020055 [Prunus dulcis]
MAVQITHFPNRGFSIGTSMHHAVLDGKSSTLFFKSWAHLCKHEGFLASSSNQLPDQLKPFYGKMVINDRAGLEPIFLNQFLNSDRPNNRSLMCTIFRAPLPPEFVRGTFEFTSTKIEALRHLVMKKKQQQYQSLHLSTFSLTCAYALVCLAKTEEIEGDKIVMIFSVDCRSRLDPPLPSNYFGNCLAGRAVVAERKGLLGEDGLVLAVNAITEVIKGLDKGLLNGAENWISTLYRDMQSTDVRVLTIVGSNRFQLYDTDFGWGRPKRTEVASIDKSGPISLSDSKNGGGGVEIGTTAPEPQEVPLPPATPWFLPEITFFDLFWLRFPPFQHIFFYELPPSSDPTPLFFDSILPKLKASLSLTLQHFLSLAGSLTWPRTSHKPILNYVQGDAVSLTIAHYSDDHRADYFDHLSSCNEFVEAIKYHPLVPKLAISHEKAAAMALQITLFPSRGFSIGTCMHHAILDGKSSTLFLKSWAHLCKHGGLLLPDQLKPFYGKVIKDPAGLESIYLNHFLNLDRPENRSLMCTLREAPVPPDSVRGTFEFTSTNIQALRHLVMKKQQQQQYQSVHFSTSRLDPPLPASHFGNCIAGGRVVAETKGLLGEDGLVLAIYDTDFGWGKPRRTEVVSIDKTGAISLSDSKNGGGDVEVGLVLEKHHMQAFASLFAKGLQDL